MVSIGASSEAEQISGLRKAAILMVMIGDEASSNILRQLDEEEVQEISREIARLLGGEIRLADDQLAKVRVVQRGGNLRQEGQMSAHAARDQ